MSQRHRGNLDAAPPPRMELRAHAHNERHRINSELQAVAARVSAGLEPDDVEEPGQSWKPLHRRDAQVAKALSARTRRPRHWKLKMWKRRSTLRRAKAQLSVLSAEQS